MCTVSHLVSAITSPILMKFGKWKVENCSCKTNVIILSNSSTFTYLISLSMWHDDITSFMHPAVFVNMVFSCDNKILVKSLHLLKGQMNLLKCSKKPINWYAHHWQTHWIHTPPEKFWILKLKVLGSPGKVSLKVMHFSSGHGVESKLLELQDF